MTYTSDDYRKAQQAGSIMVQICDGPDGGMRVAPVAELFQQAAEMAKAAEPVATTTPEPCCGNCRFLSGRHLDGTLTAYLTCLNPRSAFQGMRWAESIDGAGRLASARCPAHEPKEGA